MRERTYGDANFGDDRNGIHGHDLVVVGASTGGVEALTSLVHGLPEDLRAVICVVLHIPAQSHSYLPQILSRNSALPAAHAEDGEPLAHGRIYVAPPDRHLLIERGRVRLSRGPKENRTRPAVDPLFRSAALAYGPRVIGIVLTGALDDGTSGLFAVKECGGVAIVQNPKDALIPSMPMSALEYVDVDHCVTLSEMPALLMRLVREPADAVAARPAPELLRYEANMAEMDEGTMERADTPGTLSSLTCPECGGPIYELQDGKLIRFRCRSGHAFSYESMAAEQSEAVEEALWAAVNTLMESFQLSERLARDSRHRGHTFLAKRYADRAAEMQRRAELLRDVLRAGDSNVPEVSDEAGSREETAAR